MMDVPHEHRWRIFLFLFERVEISDSILLNGFVVVVGTEMSSAAKKKERNKPKEKNQLK